MPDSAEEVDMVHPWEANEISGLSPSGLRRYAVLGLVDCMRTLGGHYRYPRTAVERIGERVKAGRDR